MHGFGGRVKLTIRMILMSGGVNLVGPQTQLESLRQVSQSEMESIM